MLTRTDDSVDFNPRVRRSPPSVVDAEEDLNRPSNFEILVVRVKSINDQVKGVGDLGVPVIHYATLLSWWFLVEISITAAVGFPALDYEQIIKGQARNGAEKDAEDGCNQAQRKEKLCHRPLRAQKSPKIKSFWPRGKCCVQKLKAIK